MGLDPFLCLGGVPDGNHSLLVKVVGDRQPCDGQIVTVGVGIVADAGIECPYILEVAAGMFQYILGDVLWAHFRIPLLLHSIQAMLFNVLHECQVPALVTIIFSHCKHPLSVAQWNFRP